MSGKRYIRIWPSGNEELFKFRPVLWALEAGPAECVEIDLDEFPREPVTDAERYEQAERRMLFWTVEEARLRPALHGEPVLPAQDLSELRGAAREWCRWVELKPGQSFSGSDLNQSLYNALIRLFPDLAKRAA